LVSEPELEMVWNREFGTLSLTAEYNSGQMYLAFLHTNLTGLWIWLVLVIGPLVAIVCALVLRLYKKLPPELTDKSKRDL